MVIKPVLNNVCWSVSFSFERILFEDIIFVAATAAAEDAVVSTPGRIPSSNVTDFLCSNPCLVIELASEAETVAPKIRMIYSFCRSI